MNEKNKITQFLECAYVGAKKNNDLEMMCRISRAIIAFGYDDLENTPTWDEMLEYYMTKE